MRLIIIATALLSLPTHPAAGQTGNARPGPPPAIGTPPSEAGGWSLTIGAAPVLTPVWQGARDYAVSMFPDLRVNYRDVIFASIPEGLGWNAVNDGGWRAGPLVKLRFGRDERRGGSPFLIAGGSDALIGLGNIGAAAEVGGFAERRVGVWRGRVELRRGLGGHEGGLADVSVARVWRGGRALYTLGPRASFATREYHRTFFGIDAGQSARSGLAAYAPGGGLLTWGAGGTVVRPLDPRSAVSLFAGVDRLGGVAGASPLVRERGRRTQVALGLGYGYRFGL